MIEIEPLLDHIVSEKFPSFKYRENQKSTIIKILDSFINKEKKYVLLSAGTGLGKSWIGRIVAEVMNLYYYSLNSQEIRPESLFITKTISLQNQYLGDFKEMKKLMGANNYSCNCSNPLFLPPILPKDKHHLNCMYSKADDKCKYNFARKEFKASPLKCLNYAFFFAGGNYTTTGLLVCDEAHSLPQYLIDTSATIVNINRLESLIKSSNLQLDEFINVDSIKLSSTLSLNDITGIAEYCFKCSELLIQKYKFESEKISAYENDPSADSIIKEYLVNIINPLHSKIEYVQDLYKKLINIDVDQKDLWVINKVDSERDLIFQIRPIYVQDIYLKTVNTATNILLMTATGKRLKQELRIKDEDIEEITVPYTWDLDNRPILAYTDLTSLNYSNRDYVLPKYVEKIDEILAEVGGQCGLIHTASYKNAEYLKEHSKYSDRIYIPTSEELRDIKSIIKPGRFITSPAILEGISFDGDDARVQIFMKVPYPNLGDEWVSRKAKVDQGWYDYQTLLNIIQGSGRAIRSKDDFAITFMLDSSFINLYNKTKFIMPEWFKRTISFI